MTTLDRPISEGEWPIMSSAIEKVTEVFKNVGKDIEEVFQDILDHTPSENVIETVATVVGDAVKTIVPSETSAVDSAETFLKDILDRVTALETKMRGILREPEPAAPDTTGTPNV